MGRSTKKGKHINLTSQQVRQSMEDMNQQRDYNLRSMPQIKDPSQLLVWFHTIERRRKQKLQTFAEEKESLQREKTRLYLDLEEIQEQMESKGEEDMNTPTIQTIKQRLREIYERERGIEKDETTITEQIRQEMDQREEMNEFRTKTPLLYHAFIRGDFNAEQVQFVAKNMLQPVVQGRKRPDDVIREGCRMSEEKYNLPKNYWKPWLQSEGFQSKY